MNKFLLISISFLSFVSTQSLQAMDKSQRWDPGDGKSAVTARPTAGVVAGARSAGSVSDDGGSQSSPGLGLGGTSSVGARAAASSKPESKRADAPQEVGEKSAGAVGSVGAGAPTPRKLSPFERALGEKFVEMCKRIRGKHKIPAQEHIPLDLFPAELVLHARLRFLKFGREFEDTRVLRIAVMLIGAVKAGDGSQPSAGASGGTGSAGDQTVEELLKTEEGFKAAQEARTWWEFMDFAMKYTL